VNALLCNEITTFYFRYKLMNLGTQMLCQVALTSACFNEDLSI
jgi:hypothetical protein